MNDYKDLIEDLRLGLTCGPYRAVTVLKSMLSQAADAIERLVKERDEQNNYIAELHEETANLLNALDSERNSADEWQHDYFELVTKCSQLEKERDAAIADLKDHGRNCKTCLHGGRGKNDCLDREEVPCKWEWRGVKED